MDANGKFIVVDRKLPSVVAKQLAHPSSMYDKMEVFWLERVFWVEGVSPMEEFVANLPALQNLTCLKVRDCGLSSEPTSKLCAQLKFVLNLERLDLSVNEIGSAGAMLLAESIENWRPPVRLKELTLKYCNLCAPGELKTYGCLEHLSTHVGLIQCHGIQLAMKVANV